ncbi:hypothetical protein M9Y10_026190 [Tritrichomonas musculus]|uniref:Bacterial Ig-like domain-containing protein n=1 Tax=Tritrichomonas musculus TaxID=1915356 RepID=A0ABR2H6X7_9EUKA
MSGNFIDSPESKIQKLGLSLSLKNITSTSATLVFTQDNKIGTPTGELNYGEDFTLNIQKNGSWEQAPIVLEGEYGFNSIAYIITSNKTSEREIKWGWLYGSLKPGIYRINKTINDFRGPGNYGHHKISAQFKIE